MKNSFYNRNGSLTRYALACGYVETFGDDERGVRLEQFSSNGALRVIQDGRWHREVLYLGPSLGAARRAFERERTAIRRDNKETEI